MEGVALYTILIGRCSDLFVPAPLTESRRLDILESEGGRESSFFEDSALSVPLSVQAILDIGERGSNSGRSSMLRAGMLIDWRWRVSNLAIVLFVGNIYESGEKLDDKSWGFGDLIERQVSMGVKGYQG